MVKATAYPPAEVIGLEGDELEVEFSFTPGTDPSGVSGPPEHYDPGSGPEIDGGLTATLDGETLTLNDDQEGKVVEWLLAHFDFGEAEDDSAADEGDYRADLARERDYD